MKIWVGLSIAKWKIFELEIQNKTLIINSGLWYNGVFEYGVIRNLEWRYGTFVNGVIYNIYWKNGILKSALIFGGRFIRGEIIAGEVRGKADFFDCNISQNVIGNKQTVKENKVCTFTEHIKLNESLYRENKNLLKELYDYLFSNNVRDIVYKSNSIENNHGDFQIYQDFGQIQFSFINKRIDETDSEYFRIDDFNGVLDFIKHLSKHQYRNI